MLFSIFSANVAPVKVLAIATEPSGFNNSIPVLFEIFNTQEADVEFVTTPERKKLLEDRFQQAFLSKSIHFHYFDKDDCASLDKLFNEHQFDFVIGGTSSSSPLEKQGYALANQKGLPSLTVIDFWSYYRERFGLDEAEWQNKALPEKIVTIDDICYQEMIDLGFEPQRLLKAGSPYFEQMFTQAQEKSPTQKESDVFQIGFISSPRSVLNQSENWQHCGFDEYKSLNLLLCSLQKVVANQSRSYHVCIRPHPRGGVEKFAYIEGTFSENITVSVDGGRSISHYIQSCDLLTGLDSIMLMEGAIQGRPAVSIQPELIGTDRLKTNQIGLTTGVYRSQDLLPVLQKLLNNQQRQNSLETVEAIKQSSLGATKRIAQHILKRIS